MSRIKGKKNPNMARFGNTNSLGRIQTQATKDKLSKANLGNKNPRGMLGKKQTQTTKYKMHQSKLGDKNNNWKGGITPINDTIRHSIEYDLWRNAVFTRDNFTCQKTGISGGELQAHHINNFSIFSDLRFAIDNGITLLKKSHIEFHKIYGYKNNTKEQLEEFLLDGPQTQ